jgi:anaerobic selenocysteine-containing dehydrogenase
MSMVHLSAGANPPASDQLLSEPAIVARLALAAMPDSPLPWREWANDYDLIRDQIARVIDGFEGFNARVRSPGGFRIDQPAARREWLTGSGKARLIAHPLHPTAPAEGLLQLMTVRSHDQYNTTIYGLRDRYRGINGERRPLFISAQDLDRLGLQAGQRVDLVSVWHDGEREALDFLLVEYAIPLGCVASYFPETNTLVPLDHHAIGARTPASKAIPVRLRARARSESGVWSRGWEQELKPTATPTDCSCHGTLQRQWFTNKCSTFRCALPTPNWKLQRWPFPAFTATIAPPDGCRGRKRSG